MAGLGPNELALVLGQEQRGQQIAERAIGDIRAGRAAEATTAAKERTAVAKGKLTAQLAKDKQAFQREMKREGFDSAEKIAELKRVKTPEELENLKARTRKATVGAEKEELELQRLREGKAAGTLTPFQERTLALRERAEVRDISESEAATRDFILNPKKDIEQRKAQAEVSNRNPEGNIIYFEEDPFFGAPTVKAFHIPEGLQFDGQPVTKASLINLSKSEGIELSELVKQLEGIR